MSLRPWGNRWLELLSALRSSEIVTSLMIAAETTAGAREARFDWCVCARWLANDEHWSINVVRLSINVCWSINAFIDQYSNHWQIISFIVKSTCLLLLLLFRRNLAYELKQKTHENFAICNENRWCRFEFCNHDVWNRFEFSTNHNLQSWRSKSFRIFDKSKYLVVFAIFYK